MQDETSRRKPECWLARYEPFNTLQFTKGNSENFDDYDASDCNAW